MVKIQQKQVHDDDVEVEDTDEVEVDLCGRDECFRNCFCCFSHGSWYWLDSADVRTALEKLL